MAFDRKSGEVENVQPINKSYDDLEVVTCPKDPLTEEKFIYIAERPYNPAASEPDLSTPIVVPTPPSRLPIAIVVDRFAEYDTSPELCNPIPEYPGIEDGLNKPGTEDARRRSRSRRGSRSICGLGRRLFFTIIIGAILFIVAAIGAGVGASVYVKNKQSYTLPPLVAATFAAVKASTPGLNDFQGMTYFFQEAYDAASSRYAKPVYFSYINESGIWSEPKMIMGLLPYPRENSSIAAIQVPGEDIISLYYISENGTLFDVIGSPSKSNWRIGNLAQSTGWGARASKDSGIAATWQTSETGSGYDLRVYYVDSVTSTVRELWHPANEDRGVFHYGQVGEICSPRAKIAIAHLPPNNSTSSIRETVHLFYENRSGGLRHFPIYNGTWVPVYAETILPNAVSGSYFAATVSTDDTADNPISVFYLDTDNRLQRITGSGKSIREHPTFSSLGTFGEPMLVEGSPEYRRDDSLGEIPGGSITVVGWDNKNGTEQVKLLYRSNTAGGWLEEATTDLEITGLFQPENGPPYQWRESKLPLDPSWPPRS
ncbi:hypothetical protein TWF281_000161 [Arthrobotrys megalospora]